MFVGLFVAGAATGIAGTLGGKKLIELIRDNKDKNQELKELRNEMKELKEELYRKDHD